MIWLSLVCRPLLIPRIPGTDTASHASDPERYGACRSVPIRRILFAMSDPITRLNAALSGSYAIERELREGGVATVYQVDDLEHERKVAHLPRMLADEV